MVKLLKNIVFALGLVGVLSVPSLYAAPPPLTVGINPSQMVQAGETATLSLDPKLLKQIKADTKKWKSKPPLTFQWQKNGQPILGATTDTLVLTNVGFSDVATYVLVLF